MPERTTESILFDLLRLRKPEFGRRLSICAFQKLNRLQQNIECCQGDAPASIAVIHQFWSIGGSRVWRNVRRPIGTARFRVVERLVADWPRKRCANTLLTDVTNDEAGACQRDFAISNTAIRRRMHSSPKSTVLFRFGEQELNKTAASTGTRPFARTIRRGGCEPRKDSHCCGGLNYIPRIAQSCV